MTYQVPEHIRTHIDELNAGDVGHETFEDGAILRYEGFSDQCWEAHCQRFGDDADADSVAIVEAEIHEGWLKAHPGTIIATSDWEGGCEPWDDCVHWAILIPGTSNKEQTMTKNLTDTLSSALLDEEQVSITSITTAPGAGVSHGIKEFAEDNNLPLIDIRTAALEPIDFLGVVDTDYPVTDGGLLAVQKHLERDNPSMILIDEVSDHTFGRVQKIITQIIEQARAKVLIVLVGLTSSGDLPDELKQKFTITEAEPIDATETFVEFLREQKKSGVHLKVADFVEENGLSGANPHQWQLFALTQDMGLEHAAACGLGDVDLAKRFVEWQPGQGKTSQ
jgi:hypothetical protein